MSLLTNLVAYYKLDETSGTTVIDSANTHTGTSANCTVNQTGIINKAYSFNGSSSWIDVTTNPNDFNFLGDFSVAAWVNFSSTNVLRIVEKETPSGAGNVNFGLIIVSKKAYAFLDVVGGAGSGSVTGGADINNSAWHYLVMTRSGTTLTLYVDGSSVGTPATVGSNAINNTTDLYIGVAPGPIQYFAGLIDEVGLWSRALSSAEVLALYNSGNGLSFSFGNSNFLTFFS